MGELEPEYEPGPEFTPSASDLTAWSEATPVQSRTPVTDRFFAADGSPLETPELRTDAGFLAFYEGVGREQEAAESLRGPSALEVYDQGPRDEQEAYNDFVASSQAAQAHNAAVFNQEILSRVQEAGKAAGVRDESALQEVAGDALAAIAQWSQSQLAFGASGRQVWSMMAEPAFGAWLDERIGEGLQQASYDAAVANTQMRKWAARNWEQQRIGFELGTQGPPQTPFDRHPGLRRMWANMQAAAERQADRNAALQGILDEHRAHAVQTKAARDAEFERTRTRRIVNR
jgi:hypothetical protein